MIGFHILFDFEFTFQVETLEDIKEQEIKPQKVNLAKESRPFTAQRDSESISTKGKRSQASNYDDLCLIYAYLFRSLSVILVQDSEFYRVHQVVAHINIQTEPSGLYLADQFLQFLNSLPLEYNYALYRQIFHSLGHII